MKRPWRAWSPSSSGHLDGHSENPSLSSTSCDFRSCPAVIFGFCSLSDSPKLRMRTLELGMLHEMLKLGSTVKWAQFRRVCSTDLTTWPLDLDDSIVVRCLWSGSSVLSWVSCLPRPLHSQIRLEQQKEASWHGAICEYKAICQPRICSDAWTYSGIL